MKCEIMNLLDIAEYTIKQYIPEDHEMDDISWSDDGLQICVFGVRTLESCQRGPVDRFRFFLSKSETNEENAERFNRELQEFCKGWEDVE